VTAWTTTATTIIRSTAIMLFFYPIEVTNFPQTNDPTLHHSYLQWLPRGVKWLSLRDRSEFAPWSDDFGPECVLRARQFPPMSTPSQRHLR
jgi:hypothetical protein